MSKHNNKTCILCGKKYTFCNRCEEFDNYPRWMGIYCSDNCRKIFMTVTDYKAGEITREQAIDNLNLCDLSEKDKYHNSIKCIIDDLLKIENENVSDGVEIINAPEEYADDIQVKKNTRTKRAKKQQN